MKAGLSDAEFSAVFEVISSRMGLEFHVDRHRSVIRNLVLAAGEFGFNDFKEFIQWLLSADLTRSQIETLASFLTISETFFWREPDVFSALTDFVIPELINRKKEGARNIRIWSAGCSTGEEPYSLAIALHKAIPDIKDWNISILATDINPKALKKAVTGVYTKWSFRNCPFWLQTGYFRNLGNERYEILPKIREMVTFKSLNLTEDVFPSFVNDTQSMDIIFCRNVLMYFSEEWVNKISRNLFDSLDKDGWFVVASCELSSNVFPQFKPVNFKGAILYRKGDHAASGVETHSPVFDQDKSFGLSPDQQSLRIRPDAGVVHNPLMDSDTYVKLSALTTDPIMKGETVHVVKPEQRAEKITVADPISKIRIFANRGDLQQALSLCNEGIESDKLSIGLYSLRASILQELDKLNEAIASLKQAIYLDPNFIMGHFALGNLFIRRKRPRYARLHFKNVLDLISAMENDDLVPESDGLTVKYINDITMANMEKLKMI